ncbi:MAG: hypothetical protein V1729_01165 [Candidatus Woesearchaeota archaeon]
MFLTIIILAVSDVYPEYRECSEIIDSFPLMTGPDGGSGDDHGGTIAPMDAESALRMLVLRCNDAQNDMLISYALISIGVASILGGLVTSKES